MGRDEKKHSKRGSVFIPSSTETNEKAPAQTDPIDIPTVKVEEPFDRTYGELTTSQSHPVGGFHRRAITVADTGTAKNHHRRGSVGNVSRVLSVNRATFGRKSAGASERPSTAGAINENGLREDHAGEAGGHVDEEEATENGLSDDAGRGKSAAEPRPVYLKGLFSVATTSTKSPAVIRNDVRRVLDRMQVQYREVRGGFECIHLPSIDLSSINHTGAENIHDSTPVPPSSHRSKTIARKVSRLSFGRKKEKEKEKELPERPPSSISVPSTTNFDAASNAPLPTPTTEKEPSTINGQQSSATITHSTNTVDTLNQLGSIGSDQRPTTPEPSSAGASKFLPPIPRDYGTPAAPPKTPISPPVSVGQVDSDVFESTANNTLCVRFEVNIVKAGC
jgi:hypothetical protein